MHIELSPELDRIVTDRLATGRYSSSLEVVAEALVLLDGHDQSRDAQLQEFNKELSLRLEELDRGEWVEAEEVWEELERRSQEMRSKAAQ